jgi:hypothetical protein
MSFDEAAKLLERWHEFEKQHIQMRHDLKMEEIRLETANKSRIELSKIEGHKNTERLRYELMMRVKKGGKADAQSPY